MSDQNDKDAAAQKRIIDHMNADHHDSIVRYLQHYHRLSSVKAYNGSISEVSLSQLSLSCAGRTYTVAFEPPMGSYREARERLVEMDQTCREALGVSDIAVRKYVPPHGWTLGLFCVVSMTLIAFWSRGNFSDASLLGAVLPQTFRGFCRSVQPLVFWGLMVIHSIETIAFARTRLYRHGVYPNSLIYWQWLADVFIEGGGAFYRFDKLVARLQMEKAARSH